MKTSGKITLTISILFLSAVFAVGQTTQVQPKGEPAKTPTTEPSRSNIDETFDLNIDLRRFTRENFEASTAVSTDGDQRVNVQVGVGLAAGRIEVLLRNVQGKVRFRGSLDRLFEVIDNRRGPTVAPD